MTREEGRDIFAETGSTDWFPEAGDDPAAVYLSYMGQASEIYSEILSSDHGGSRGFQAASIAEEAVPLFDQLPDELNPEEKASILKEYYGDLLSALETIKNL